jgi:hypothetical protein
MVDRIKEMKCLRFLVVALAIFGCQKSHSCPSYYTLCHDAREWRTMYCDKFPDSGRADEGCPSIQEVQTACSSLAPSPGGPAENDAGACCYQFPNFCS